HWFCIVGRRAAIVVVCKGTCPTDATLMVEINKEYLRRAATNSVNLTSQICESMSTRHRVNHE
ncbi:MAG: hypothetical protein ABJZ69_15645, partial [Hyphomicrobiales bacterium]